MLEHVIRKLTRKDRKVLTGLILKFVKKTGRKELVGMVPSSDMKEEVSEEKETENVLSMSMDVLKDMLDVIETDVTVWFADLIGVTVEEFDCLDFDIEIDIISQLVTSDKFKSFFSKGLQLRKEISDFASRFKN